MKQDAKLDQLLPAAVDAERVLLGAVLLDNTAWDHVAGLSATDWSIDSHRRIRMAMKRLATAGCAIDIVTLANDLTGRHEIEAVGGVSYLASLTEGLPRRPAIDDYLQIIRQKGLARNLILTCNAAIDRARDQSEPILDVVSDVSSRLEEFTQPLTNSDKAPVKSFIATTIDEVMKEYNAKTQPAIPSGNGWFDSKTGGGYRTGKYTIVAARPKIGKSSWGITSTAYNCSRDTSDVHVTWFSLEMEKKEILLNLVPYISNLPNIVCVRPWLRTPEQQMEVLNALAEIGDWDLSINDGEMDDDQICWTMDRDARKHERVLFILDHFGLVSGGDKDIRKRYVERSERYRKKIKQHRNAALLALFQLNEVPREYADKRPQRSDIGESKKPLQDCFAAAFLHRYQDKETLKMTRKANINLELIRGGGSPGNVDCEFNPRRLEFEAQAELEYESQGSEWYQDE